MTCIGLSPHGNAFRFKVAHNHNEESPHASEDPEINRLNKNQHGKGSAKGPIEKEGNGTGLIGGRIAVTACGKARKYSEKTEFSKVLL